MTSINLHPGTAILLVRLLTCAVLTLALCSSATVGTASAAPAEKPRLIVYAGGKLPGVQVQKRSDAKHLRGAPRTFQRYIGSKAQRLVARSTCPEEYVGVTVGKVRTDGFAVGSVSDCGGYAALWAVTGGHWTEVQATQDTWTCGVLRRHRVPSSIAGTRCYDRTRGKVVGYRQR